MSDLINSPYNLLPRQSINDLVPEHLEDLYKDIIKLDCINTKININGEDSIYVESARYVEYIQGDGISYIDTGIYPNPQWKHEMILTDIKTISDECYFGTSGQGGLQVQRNSNSTAFNIRYNDDRYIGSTISSSNKITFDKNLLYIDDSLIKTFTESSSTTPYQDTMLILSCKWNNKIDIKSNAKLYSFKMWDENGTLQFDGRPCLVNEKYPALYDEVSKKFFFPQS